MEVVDGYTTATETGLAYSLAKVKLIFFLDDCSLWLDKYLYTLINSMSFNGIQRMVYRVAYRYILSRSDRLKYAA